MILRYLPLGLLVPLLTAMSVRAEPPSPNPAMRELAATMQDGLHQRQLTNQFQELAAFFAGRLDASAGTNTFSDKTGNCRLVWVDWLLRHPAESIGAGETFTRQLHDAARRERDGVGRIVDLAAEKLRTVDAAGRAGRGRTGGPTLAAGHGNPGLAAVGHAVTAARAHWDAALSPLSAAELTVLRAELYPQLTQVEGMAHRAKDKKVGRRVCELLAKMDQPALLAAARAVAPLTDPRTVRSAGRLSGRARVPPAGVKGPVVAVVETAGGLIVVGGREANEYRLEEMTNVCAVVDQGGDDTYREGTVTPSRPVLVIVDLAGNDVYRGTQPGIQGGAVLGVSVLVDLAGDDQYDAQDVAQGSCLGGIGILVDAAGNDTYRANSRVQGQAVGGIGLLLDRRGDDRYRAAVLGQGVGGPLGLGLLDDLAGADQYYVGGKYLDPYDDSAGYSGFGQGAGVGPRGSANGGIGVLLDGGGDDLYESDCFAHAGAYWFAAGFARDFSGNDRRIGATLTAFDGGERSEARFVRYGVGFGCHYGVCAIYDDAGDDTYFADFAGPTFAWDVAVAAICDFQGNDRYDTPGHGLASAKNAALSVLFDAAGDDVYAGRPPAMTEEQAEYHPDDPRARNFGFLIDLAGQDAYPEDLANGRTYQRGWAGGFLIDR